MSEPSSKRFVFTSSFYWTQLCFVFYPTRYIFAALFAVVVVVVMLNLLVSLLNDLYEELKILATADWCRAQVQ